MKLSVIILNYKVPYHLLLCLQSVQLALEGINAEVIVVDNFSEDESTALVKKHFPKVILFENERNEGFSRGNNHGVNLAKGEYICLLNPDTVVSETIFKKTLQFAENHSNFGAIGVKMIDGTGNFLPECKRNFPSPKVAFQKLVGNDNGYYAQHLNPNETGEVEVLVGAFMLMKKCRYYEVGRLDEDYFMYGEDIDLSYKLTKAGYQNYYFGAEIILHYKGESTTKNTEYTNRFYGAMQLFYKKHFHGNLALDVLIKSGLESIKFFSRFRSTNKDEVCISIRQTYLVANKEVSFLDKLKKSLGNTIELISLKKESIPEIENNLFVFDSGSVSFRHIFEWMEKYKNKGNCFLIKPENFRFVIGSDSSSYKGNILFLD